MHVPNRAMVATIARMKTSSFSARFGWRQLISWPAMLVYGVASFVLLNSVVPALLGSRPAGAAFVPVLQALAIVIGVIFIGIGAVGFWSARKEAALDREPVAAPEPPPAPPKRAPEPSVTSTTPKRELDAIEWDKTMVVPHPTAVRPAAWARDVIDRMEWRRFELVVEAFFKVRGYRTEIMSRGPDGSCEAKLVRASDQALIALMHAQPGGAVVVGAEQLRAVIGTMAQARTGRAIYVAAGRFDEGALEFAKAHPIQLLSGDMLLAKILQIPEDRRNALLALATEGEWTTPTCPACAAKMVRRAGGGHDFWVCSNMPQCTATMPVAQS